MDFGIEIAGTDIAATAVCILRSQLKPWHKCVKTIDKDFVYLVSQAQSRLMFFKFFIKIFSRLIIRM